MKPRLAIIPGDPSGIGPELVARISANEEILNQADVLLVGDRHVFMKGAKQATVEIKLEECNLEFDDWQGKSGLPWYPTESIQPYEVDIGKSTKASGRSVIATLDVSLGLLQDSIIDGLVFAPFNKEAMHMAGLGHADELHYMAEKLKVNGFVTELNTLDGLWVSRVTSHMALRDVACSVTEEGICKAVLLLNKTLKASGIDSPRIAVAALNPHAGEGGSFGDEEIEIIHPALAKLRSSGIDVCGPMPSDTIFLKARAGEVDGVVAMYHDQGQIALKLMGFDRGVTVHGGLPFPITTPAHGTAFDIAGQGNADDGAMTAAFEVACDLITAGRSSAE